MHQLTVFLYLIIDKIFLITKAVCSVQKIRHIRFLAGLADTILSPTVSVSPPVVLLLVVAARVKINKPSFWTVCRHCLRR